VLLTPSHWFRNQVVDHLAALDHNSQKIHTLIPTDVLEDIDNARNPMLLTKERLERAATENQFMNGKIGAIEVSSALSPDASSPAYIPTTVLQNIPQRGTRSKFPGARATSRKG
jgi:mediator of RNA polymerase II transcription subunit 10